MVKKSYECSEDEDCINSRGVASTCGCTVDPQKQRVCSAGPEDEEWLVVKDAFVKYLIGTTYCHPGRGLTACMRPDLFNDFKCKELKAKYYTLFLEIDKTCLKDIKAGNDIFSLYNMYCMQARNLFLRAIFISLYLLIVVIV